MSEFLKNKKNFLTQIKKTIMKMTYSFLFDIEIT